MIFQAVSCMNLPCSISISLLHYAKENGKEIYVKVTDIITDNTCLKAYQLCS